MNIMYLSQKILWKYGNIENPNTPPLRLADDITSQKSSVETEQNLQKTCSLMTPRRYGLAERSKGGGIEDFSQKMLKCLKFKELKKPKGGVLRNPDP